MGFGVPYLVISPTVMLNFIGLLVGPDKTIPTPAEDWRTAIVDVVIPAYNEEKNIVLCLSSIKNQTFPVRRVYICDDGSQDRTRSYAEKHSQFLGVDIILVTREKSEGKTASLKYVAKNSDAHVIFVLDGDTILRSDNYLESLLYELYQGIGNASACGTVLPMMEKDRKKAIDKVGYESILQQYPATLWKATGWYNRLQYAITNFYREELYLFLQKFIYHGEMIFFGTIINPVGCAVAYRRAYLKKIFDFYQQDFGNNLTTSEDIFIGFAFIDAGYKNIMVNTVYALTQEPKFSELPKQLLKWSSSYLQCCYYFDELVATPFKVYKVIYKKLKSKYKKNYIERRKIKEAYRQGFGIEISKNFGRPIGWYIFTAAFEKCTYPFILLLMIYFELWEVLAYTFAVEIILYTFLITYFHKNRRLKNAIKSIIFTPVRYMVLIFDIFVIANFLKDIYFTENRAWRK